MSDQETFESSESGASLTFPIQCSALRKNGHVLMKDHPCKIVDMSTSKTGKHGHAKVNMVGIDIFTGKKYEDISPSTHNMNVPKITRLEYTLLDITDDGFVSLMAHNGEMKEDIKVPEGETGEKLRADFDDGKELVVMVLSSMEQEMIVQFKESSGK